MSDRTRQGLSFKPIGSLHGKPVFVQAGLHFQGRRKRAHQSYDSLLGARKPIVRSCAPLDIQATPVVRSSNAVEGDFDPETAAIERNGPIVRSSLTVVHLIEKGSGDRAQHADIRPSETLLVQVFSFLS